MASYTTYRAATGEIVAQISCPETAIDKNCGGNPHIDGTFRSDEFYVLAGVATAKTAMSPAVTGMTISNLPTPCTARIENVLYQITDGVLELDADMPGPYEVTLNAVAFLEKKVTVA